MMGLILLLSICGLLLSYITIKLFKNMYLEADVVRPNYRNEMIPVAMGVSFALPIVIIEAITYLIDKNTDPVRIIIIVISLSLLGLLDDLIGNRNDTGLKGHLGRLFKTFQLTTGALKAVGGCLLALLICFDKYQFNWAYLIVGAMIFALSINSVNLFDLRPGRAIKFSFLFLIIIIVFAINRYELLLSILPIVCIVGVYFPFDLRAKMMMGDAGSNVLGGICGYISVSFLSLNYQFVLLALLILLHLLAEKLSITKIIEKNFFLRILDELGRR